MIAACSQRLTSEIASRSPKVVLAAGATAAQALTGTSDGITKIQGTMSWNDQVESFVLPTYHPAAVLHGNTGYFDAIFDDTRRAVRMSTGQVPLPDRHFELDWELCGTVTRSIQALHEIERDAFQTLKVSLDTESVAPNDGPRPIPGEDEWIMLQLYAGRKAYAFNMRHLLKVPEFMERLAHLLCKIGIQWRMHNMSYDLQVIRANDLPEPEDVRDTMLYGLGLTERGEQVGLKALSRSYLNASYYEKELVESGFKWSVGPRNYAEWWALGKYGCLDVYNTYELGDILPPLVWEEGTQELVEELLHPAARAFSDLEYHGTLTDLVYTEELEEEWLPLIEEAERAIKAYAQGEGFPYDDSVVGQQKKAIVCPECSEQCLATDAQVSGFWSPGPDRRQWRQERIQAGYPDESCKKCMKRRFVLIPDLEINVRSPQQLQHLAFDILGMRHPDRKRSADAGLWEYNTNHPLTKLMGELKERDHLLRNYIRSMAKNTWCDGRLHPDFLLFGTVTGRLSIQKPALQTLPKWGVNPKMAKMVRKCIKASPGHVIVDIDYKNLELFIAWHYSKDPNLGVALMEQDFHTTTASAIFNTPYDQVTGDQRFNSKFVTFGIAYGRQAYSLAQGELHELTGGNERQAQMYVDRFWEQYPLYKEAYDGWQQAALTEGELRTPTGRVRRWRLITPDKINHIRNQAVNFPIQSLASDTCLSALIRLNRILRELDLGVVLFTVHDSLVFEIREDRLDEAMPIIIREMTTPPYETHIKLFVDVEVGPSLGEVETYLTNQTAA